MPKTTYVWDELSDNVIEEFELGVLTASYDHEPGLYGNLLRQTRNGVTSYFHYDGRGDAVALTDDSSTVTDTKEYDAWGNVIASTGSTPSPYWAQGRSGAASLSEGFLAVADSLYAPNAGRWISSLLSVSTRPLTNIYFSSITIDTRLESQCRRILMATMAGWKTLGNNCAYDLMKASFSGVAASCPDSCVTTIRKRGFDYILPCAEKSFAVFGECGKNNSYRFHTNGSHAELDPGTPKLNSPLSDMFYAFGKFEWSADGYCSWNCQASTIKVNELGLQCCPCEGLCGFEVVVKDIYDYGPPPTLAPTILGPLYCAKLFGSLGILRSMVVRCPVGLTNQHRISGQTCSFCSPLWSDDPIKDSKNRPKRRPYDPTSGDGWCPGTASSGDGKIIFRNPNSVFDP